MKPDPSNNPAALDYASAATDSGVFYTSDDEVSTIVIHRPERSVYAAMHATGSLLSEGLLLWILLAITGWALIEWLVVPAFLGLLAGVFGLAWLWTWKLRKPIIIRLTDQELSVTNLNDATLVWPRDAIYDLRYISHAGSILVRTRGEDMAEFQPTLDLPEVQRIARFLREKLGLDETEKS